MAKDDKLTFLEQLSNALVGQSATSGAKALGEGIGYGFGGGALSDIPDVMREAIEEHKQRTANQSKNEQDALEVASGLAAMSNPYSAVGHAMDFVGAVPDMIKYKLSDAEAPIGTIAETGLKRRLQKGGAAAEYATQNSLQRSQQLLKNQGMVTPREQFMLMESPADKWPFGAGKFQSINNYKTKAFDLSKMKEQGRPISMGADRDTNYVISAIPHQLGVEFSNTHGLKPEYRGKGYGQQIYQNMADEYGGGISHSGSTSDAARRVYDALNAIDTGIPSGGGLRGETRMALPTRAMKEDPEAMAAFEQKVKEYAEPRLNKNKKNVQRSESRPQQTSSFSPAERITGEIDYRLMRAGLRRARLPGPLVFETFGNSLNFRKQMNARGYDVEFDAVDRMFNVTRKN